MARLIYTIRDFSDEYASATFYVDNPSGAAFDYDAWLASFDTFQTALAAVTAGTIAKRTIVVDDSVINDVRPLTPWAQREMKWLIRYQDDITKRHYTFTLPCAALELMSDGGDDQLDIVGVTAAATYVSWLEANARSPEGNSITVNSMSFVGRNL